MAKKLSAKKVVVTPTSTLPQGPVSNLAYDAMVGSWGSAVATELQSYFNSLLRLNQDPVTFNQGIEFTKPVKMDDTLTCQGNVAAKNVTLTEGDLKIDHGNLLLTQGTITNAIGDIVLPAGLVRAIGFSMNQDSSTPTVTLDNANWGTDASINELCNSGHGKIEVTAGPGATAGAQLKVEYAVHGMFGASPKIILVSEEPTPFVINAMTDDFFTFYLVNAPISGKVYVFHFFVMG